jgi:hypothetical protein
VSYESCETALFNTLCTAEGLGPENISRGDYSLLDSGLSQVVVLDTGPWQANPFTAVNHRQTIWTVYINIGVQYDNDVQVHNDMRALRQLVVDTLRTTPQLGDATNVFDSNLVAGQPLPTPMDNGTNKFLFEEMQFEIIDND